MHFIFISSIGAGYSDKQCITTSSFLSKIFEALIVSDRLLAPVESITPSNRSAIYSRSGILVISGDGTLMEEHFNSSAMKSTLEKSKAVQRKPTFFFNQWN